MKRHKSDVTGVQRRLFITFEGLDGAGKSTQIERLLHKFQAQGLRVVMTREPGGTEIGNALREILLDPKHTALSPRTEALLYAASRAQLLHQVIRPALERGDVVLCDRYVDASLAYQGAGLGLGSEEVARLNRFATEDLKPNLTFLFDLPVQESQSRVLHARSGSAPDRIERRDAEYFQRVRQEFLRIAAAEPERVVVLDATASPERLEQEIWNIVANRYVDLE
ncbi:dTMP kinase [Alicyclobacillus pomorum]|uniref:dTMP kinase n=1 Tax=Alicyclobacillus pomorum TaxID=204470 RepID=UPI0012EBCD6E|nr:dTMP kinase [Alicyclobacillus pomorum]